MAIERVDYLPEYALEVVKMWRLSFQRAMGIREHNEFADLSGHLGAFTRIDPDHLHLLMETASSQIVAFMAFRPGWVDQLYVHVDWQGQGLGSQLLNQAKSASRDGLQLYTFQRNTNAQAFYLAHGFREVERGAAAADENPWATSKEELADILYAWEPAQRHER
jgi:ribosomal protein S18 acetylase RimI-like enzyme